MKTRVGALALLALLSLVGVSLWATAQQPIGAALADLIARPGGGQNPWFVATLFDAYFGFFWFWAFVAYRERTWPVRIGWLVAILLLGNIAMAIYMLLALSRLPRNARAAELFLQRA
jgi:hypothetical protein